MPKTYAGKNVRQRVDLCGDLLAIRADAQSLQGINALAGKVILNQRAAAVRRLLGASGDVAHDPFDDLMSPSSAGERLKSMVEALDSMEPSKRLASAERIKGIGDMLRALATAQKNLGITGQAPVLHTELDMAAQQAVIKLTPDQPERNYQAYDAMREANMRRGALSDDDKFTAADAHRALEEHRGIRPEAMFPELVAERQKIADEANAVWDEITKAASEFDPIAQAEAEQRYNQLVDKRIEAHKRISAAYQAETDHIQGRLASVGKKQIQRLLDASGVTEDEAKAWADSQEITKTASARLTKTKYPAATVRRDMAEFYRLTGGRMNAIKIDSKGDRRANAVGVGDHAVVGTIYLDGDFDKRVLFHEMAHHLESDPAMFKASANYIRAMATSQEPVQLRTLHPGAGYGSSEVALQGGFYSAYVGKVYNHGATEVMSMGVEAFAEPWKLGWVIGKDPATIEFVTGALLAEQSDEERMHAKLRAFIANINGEAKENQSNELEQAWARLASTVKLNKVSGEQAIAWFNKNTYYGSVYQRDIEKGKMTPVGTTGDGGELGDQIIICSEMVKNERTRKRLKGYRIYYRAGVGLSTREVGVKNLDAALAIIAIFNKEGMMHFFSSIDTVERVAKYAS